MPGDDAWLPPVELTPSGRPVLLPDEVERLFISSIDLEAEENPTLTALRSGFLSLTSHRLIWINDVSRFARSIPLDSVIYAFPPNKKSIKNMFASPRIRIQVSANGDGKVVGGRGTASLVLTIVMRGGKSDSEAFYGKLWEVLKSKSWEVEEVKQREKAGEMRVYGSGEGPSRARVAMVGVAGILRKEQEMWESTDKSLHDAFQDLSALMSKAKEMVALAEKMRQKLLSGSIVQTNTDEEMDSKQEMQDWLLSVGVISPVTKESAGALYHQQLSRQLADFVKLPLDKAGGMIALVDVYCLFNRARGTELISPEDLLQACALWEKYEVPVMLRKFYSGLMVIQSKAQSDEEVFAKISSLAEKPETLKVGISPSDAALTLGIAPALAKEHLLNAESKGLLCRDVSPDGFRFYANLFKEIEPRNIYLVKDHGLYNAWICAASSALA